MAMFKYFVKRRKGSKSAVVVITETKSLAMKKRANDQKSGFQVSPIQKHINLIEVATKINY